MSRSVKLFIAFSLLLNLLLAGVVIGNTGRDYMMDGRKRYTLQEVIAALPEGKRQQFEERLRSADADVTKLRQQVNDARKKANDILRAEPFDKNAYMQQVEQIHQLYGQVQQRTAEVVVDIAALESPPERAALAEMLHNPLRPSKTE